MCTFNGEKYLCQQLDSIVNQTYPIYELIVQDDCSTDGTFSVLEEYAKQYPYIKLFKNKKNKGINDNFFSAMDRATGDYIAISDQDDIWEPNKIEIQIETIGDNWLSTHFSKPFSEDNAPIHFNAKKPNVGIERCVYISAAGHTMLFKREISALIPQNGKDKFIYDKALQMIASANNKTVFCEQILVNQRRHFRAATYNVPLITKFNLLNSVKTVFRTLFLYWEIRNDICGYFKDVLEFLTSLPFNTDSKANAKKMALYHSQKGLIAYLKQVRLCIKLRKKIFYSSENNDFIAILRCFYFPISCADYFCYLSKRFSK